MHSRLPPAVLLDMDVPGLAIARSLGRRGVEVWGLHAAGRRWSMRSRYCRMMIVPGPTENQGALLEALADLGRSARGAVLYALHDDYLAFVAGHRAQLEPWFRIAHPHNSAIEALVDKRRLASICAQAGIAIPRTWAPDEGDGVRDICGDICYPCLIKPAYSRAWRTPAAERLVGGAKALRIASSHELLAEWRGLRGIGSPLIVQEIIPGPDENLYYSAGYYGAGGAPLAQFAGRKLRTLPVHLGAGTLVESVSEPGVHVLARRLAQALDYRGNLGVEFKLDPRDGGFKLIEANARFGLWDGFAADCGVDLAYCAYRDAVGAPISFNGSYRTSVRWLHLRRDLDALIEMRRKGEIGLGGWLLSLAKVRSHAALAGDDLGPFMHYCLAFAADLSRRLARKARTG